MAKCSYKDMPKGNGQLSIAFKWQKSKMYYIIFGNSMSLRYYTLYIEVGMRKFAISVVST